MVMAERYSYSSPSARKLPTARQRLLSIRGNYVALVLIVVSVLYNAVLAMLVARGINLGYSTVAAVEILIIVSCLALSVSTGLSTRDIMPIALLWFICINLF
jgi:hypothetical protein